jgi:hypothetical protein
MEQNSTHQMAIDLLCCHLGISEDEAQDQLGIVKNDQEMQQRVIETQAALMNVQFDQ